MRENSAHALTLISAFAVTGLFYLIMIHGTPAESGKPADAVDIIKTFIIMVIGGAIFIGAIVLGDKIFRPRR